MHKNNKWYARDAIVKIIQGSGRSIRSENDWAETFVLDSNFVRLLNKDKELFPKWFLEGIQIFDK
jgi:Rad3-related DNA helicase